MQALLQAWSQRDTPPHACKGPGRLKRGSAAGLSPRGCKIVLTWCSCRGLPVNAYAIAKPSARATSRIDQRSAGSQANAWQGRGGECELACNRSAAITRQGSCESARMRRALAWHAMQLPRKRPHAAATQGQSETSLERTARRSGKTGRAEALEPGRRQAAGLQRIRDKRLAASLRTRRSGGPCAHESNVFHNAAMESSTVALDAAGHNVRSRAHGLRSSRANRIGREAASTGARGRTWATERLSARGAVTARRHSRCGQVSRTPCLCSSSTRVALRMAARDPVSGRSCRHASQNPMPPPSVPCAPRDLPASPTAPAAAPPRCTTQQQASGAGAIAGTSKPSACTLAGLARRGA